MGQTSQKINKRLALHKSDPRLYPERSALAVHVFSTKHAIDYKNCKLLHKEDNYSKRIFLEMAFIAQEDD